MAHVAIEQERTSKQTTLQKTLTSALNELGMEAALVAIFDRQDGPLVAHGYRGFSPREVQAVVRTLSARELNGLLQSRAVVPVSEQGDLKAVRLRMITAGPKSLLGIPLRYKQMLYGALVVGKKESAGFSKKDKATLETSAEGITSALERAQLFGSPIILGRPLVSQEPVQAPGVEPARASLSSPDAQDRMADLLREIEPTMSFERAWVAIYDPVAAAVEVAGMITEHKTAEQKRDLKPGQRLALDASASGWTVRHRKARLDHDLASTQGRFQDYKQLFKDKFKSALVVPFFVRGQVGGTITLASRAPMQYSLSDVRVLEPLTLKLAELLQEPLPGPAPAEFVSPGKSSVSQPPAIPEPLIRRQERQTALGEFSSFLATEVREPLASIRAQLEEITGEGTLDFDPQTRVENAMRDLIRVEMILNEILDFAKPLELNRRACRVPDVIESALTVVATDLDMNRIRVTKEYAANLPQVRCDDAKMQQVFLSIFKNSLEAMNPGGHLHIETTHPKGPRSEVQITIKNDGEPIPTEHVGKVFEPYFTTKRTGTGLGLATVKKIVEEHHGQISIASGPGQGTAVIIRLPALQRPGYHRRGRGRRPRGGRA
jgi:putative methionine-R-sulfoxide reductase with GAF domain